LTNKGKGYPPAENHINHLHSIEKIDKTLESNPQGSVAKPPKYTEVFGETMLQIGASNPKVVAITAAMAEGTGLERFAREFPERFFDVGIAESHAVTFAAGLAMQGIIPVVAIYSTFLQRAFDQITHDCALQNLHVVFAIDRAGIVGSDGATHHGLLDLAYLRCIPNMTIIAPKDEQELRNMLFSAVYHYNKGPVAVRYPRGWGPGAEIEQIKLLPYGKWEILCEGSDLAIIATGKMVHESIGAAELLQSSGISAAVINARFIKPIDENMLDGLSVRFTKIITVEDGTVTGGLGTAVAGFISQKNSNIEIKIHGIQDEFIEHGSQSELLHDAKLDVVGIADEAAKFVLKGMHISSVASSS
jgi:1-deoxy-D-xylulose-5-phosphate synthase